MPAKKKNADQDEHIISSDEMTSADTPKKRRSTKSKSAEDNTELAQSDVNANDEAETAPKKRRSTKSKSADDVAETTVSDANANGEAEPTTKKRRSTKSKLADDAAEPTISDANPNDEAQAAPAKRRASSKKSNPSETASDEITNANAVINASDENEVTQSASVDQQTVQAKNLENSKSLASNEANSTNDVETGAEADAQFEPKKLSRNRFFNMFSPQNNVVVPPVQQPTTPLSTEAPAAPKAETPQTEPVQPVQAQAEIAQAVPAPQPKPAPFVPKTLARPRRVWFGSRSFPSLNSCMPDAVKILPASNKLKIERTLSADEAANIQMVGMRKNYLPSCPRDCSPLVLENIRRLPRHRFIRPRKQTAVSSITFEKKRRLNDYITETMPPLHIASSLVGGEYAYNIPSATQESQPQQPVTMTLGELQASMANGGPFANNQQQNQPDPYAFFDFFDTPIQVFDYSKQLSSASQASLQYQHTVNHCSNILSLLKVWASQMSLVDMDLKRPSDNAPITQLFYKRFLYTLQSDFNTAYELGVYLPDMRLSNRFDLDDTDLFILWTIAALQIDPDFREHLVPTWTLGNVVVMSAAVIMRFMANSQKQRSDLLHRMSPSGPLQTKGLLRSAYARSPTMPLFYELTVPEQLSLQFAGSQSLSTPTSEYATLCYPTLSPDTYIAPENEMALRIIQNFTTRPQLNAAKELNQQNLNIVPSLPFFIEGLPGSGRTTLMKIIASKLQKPMIVVNCAQLITLSPDDLSTYFIELFQDALMLDALVALKDASTLLSEARYVPIITRHLSNYAIVCAFCVDLKQAVTPEMEPFVTFKTKMVSNLKENAVAIWKQHLGNLPLVNTSNVNMLDLSRALALQPFQIQKAARLAYYASDVSSDDIFEPESVPLSNMQLHRAASSQVAKNIGTLAFISDPEVTLDDVIVSDEIMSKIKQIIGSAQNRRRVLYDWGLSKRIRRGTGVICLFDGEPGTGKTHSAEAIAQSLGLQLMRVNIASMVDKYIGETEKNLTKIFEQARPDMSLLLFDEADSLFTKRTSNVSKSNDRYSNMSVNVLLQLVERYEGVSVLTTNLKNSIDPAFERRITYKIYFGMPKKEERIRLWKYMCPPDVVTAEPLDYEWLGELEMSGGEIKNAVLAGAFRAATMGKLLDTEFLYDAGVTEATAAGRVLRHYGEDDDGFN